MHAVIACDMGICSDVVGGDNASSVRQYAVNDKARSMVEVNRKRILKIS